ncbi:acyl-CoA dehydrogenase family protein, partial [Paracoccus sp. PXZ]
MTGQNIITKDMGDSMDFGLSEEQQAIFDLARDFGAEHIAPQARAWEEAGSIPRELWARSA